MRVAEAAAQAAEHTPGATHPMTPVLEEWE